MSLRPSDLTDLIYCQVIEYIGGSSTSVPAIIAAVSADDQPWETLVAMVDACIWRISADLTESRGAQGALDYARGMVLHNELSRIEHESR